MNDEKRKLAIKYIEECKNTHESWMNFRKHNLNWREIVLASDVGDIKHHSDYVEKYNLVLEVLKSSD